ncbi:MAG: carboxypeptidase-like regulatory domain-containing protein [Sphingobacteriales bacterium]|nr:carboxypeptidase-like regulatory domain-containing protein [Sphingobacteriales bacterium]
MNKELYDIEIIRKYLSGELSPAAMQELEARALNDPFLRDALDGFERAGMDPSILKNLQNKLDHRIKKKDKIFAINWGLKHWGIAASVIIGISVLSIYLNQTPENQTIAISELQQKEGLPESVKIKIDNDKAAENTEDLLDKSPALTSNETQKLASTKAYSPADEISLEPLADAINADTVHLGDLKVTDISALSKEDLSATSENKTTANSVTAAKMKVSLTDIIKGKVTDITSGDALPGVQITDLSNGNSTLSDEKGNFTLSGKYKDKIEAKYIGFLTEQLLVNTKDSLKIDLKPDNKAFSEVVSIDYSKQNIDNNTLAQPDGGWHTFRKYLDREAHLPSQEKGRVVVQFTITAIGKLTDFKILKSFSPEASDLALKLVKDYHAWRGAKNGTPQKARVTVRFK